jgi:hypothetical protein
MRPLVTGLLMAGLLGSIPAAGARAQAAGAFPVIPLPAPVHVSHTWAYASLAAGAGLVGASFALAGRADDTYEALLATGIYLRFLRVPNAARARLALGPRSCGVSLRF